ncbi:MAG: hypothetical protein HY681_15425 [Chloroflexi bacterium]|nr:hypothetical protein [Chloroflexota bacterium]
MEGTRAFGVVWERLNLPVLAGLLALGASATHFAVMLEHFEEWWGLGAFFLVVGGVQGLYAVGLMAPWKRLAAAPWYLIAGLAFNMGMIGIYAISRTVGMPFLGEHGGHAEEIGAVDLLSKALEVGTVASLSALLFGRGAPGAVLLQRLKWVGAVALALGVAMSALWFEGRAQSEEALIPSRYREVEAAPSTGGDPALPALPTVKELFALLARTGNGPNGVPVEAVLLPPVFFQVVGEEPPEAGTDRQTLVFLLEETDHDYEFGLLPDPPPMLLRLDGGNAVQSYQVIVVDNGSEHRSSQHLFPLPPGVIIVALETESHALTLVMPLGPMQESLFSWQTPLAGLGFVSKPARETDRP